MSKAEQLGYLRQEIAKAERRFCEADRAHAWQHDFSLDGGIMDQVLAGGLGRGALHAVSPQNHMDGPAALGFVFRLLCRFQSERGQGVAPVLWSYTADSAQEFGIPYGPGLCQAGLDPGSMIFVEGRREEDVLWSAEEGLKVPELAAVVAVSSGHERFDFLTLTRRLQLAAETSGVTIFFIRLKRSEAPTAARSHWRVAACPGSAPTWAGALLGDGSGGQRIGQGIGQGVGQGIGLGASRFQLHLARYRGGAPQSWTVEWDNEAFCFCVVSSLADRPVLPTPGATERTREGADVIVFPDTLTRVA